MPARHRSVHSKNAAGSRRPTASARPICAAAAAPGGVHPQLGGAERRPVAVEHLHPPRSARRVPPSSSWRAPCQPAPGVAVSRARPPPGGGGVQQAAGRRGSARSARSNRLSRASESQPARRQPRLDRRQRPGDRRSALSPWAALAASSMWRASAAPRGPGLAGEQPAGRLAVRHGLVEVAGACRCPCRQQMSVRELEEHALGGQLADRLNDELAASGEQADRQQRLAPIEREALAGRRRGPARAGRRRTACVWGMLPACASAAGASARVLAPSTHRRRRWPRPARGRAALGPAELALVRQGDPAVAEQPGLTVVVAGPAQTALSTRWATAASAGRSSRSSTSARCPWRRARATPRPAAIARSSSARPSTRRPWLNRTDASWARASDDSVRRPIPAQRLPRP